MGLVEPDGTWEHHGGKLRFIDSSGSIIADQIDPQNYHEYIGEAVQTSSYLKSPYYTPLGFPDGMYRVGPLARLNVCRADGHAQGRRRTQEIQEARPRRRHLLVPLPLRAADRNPRLPRAHRASTWTIPDLLSDDLRADAGINSLRGVGVSEAPARHACSTITPWIATACCRRST